jgi:hypothetical protein
MADSQVVEQRVLPEAPRRVWEPTDAEIRAAVEGLVCEEGPRKNEISLEYVHVSRAFQLCQVPMQRVYDILQRDFRPVHWRPEWRWGSLRSVLYLVRVTTDTVERATSTDAAH